MKVAERIIEVDSTLTGEKIRMGIDEDAVQHIIGVLTDLYADPELAVIREYSTNALDANREAGNDAPIEVTLPTTLAPFFRVKDAGIGLGAEEIRNIYSKYGASTKRDSNEQVGMLGLGAKSALTYTDQFTIIGTKDGRTINVSVARDEDGGVSQTIVSDEPSSDPSGVEVIVPVKRHNDFELKALEFFRFWTPGTVLVNGEEPQHITADVDPTWLTDELFIFGTGRDDYWYRPDPGWVVMGNVAYPIPEEEGIKDAKFSIVAFVDIGEVNFTPSREALMLTKLTKGTLARIREDVQRELATATQRDVENAATPSEAIRLTQKAAAWGVKTENITYQGKPVPTELDRTKKDAQGNVLSMSDAPESTFLVVGGDRYRKKNGERYRKIPPYNSERMIFTGFTGKELSLPMRQKIDVWAQENDVTLKREKIFVDELSTDEAFWLDGVPTFEWEPIKKIKLAKDGTVGGFYTSRPRGSYELVGGGSILAADIDTEEPILMARRNERYIDRTRNRIPANATLVVMPLNRVEKFQRDFPSAEWWDNYVMKEAKDWLNQQDPDALKAVKLRMSGSLDDLKGLDPARVYDTELGDAIRWANDPRLAELERGVEARSNFLPGWDRYSLRQADTDPLKKYPLANDTYRLRLDKHAEHFYLYVNAVHAAQL